MSWQFSLIDCPQSMPNAPAGFNVHRHSVEGGAEVTSYAAIMLDRTPRPLAEFIADLESVVQQLKALEGAK